MWGALILAAWLLIDVAICFGWNWWVRGRLDNWRDWQDWYT